MNRHLVAVEVGVERGTAQRVELDGATFNEHRRERLDTKSVQRRRTVEQYGVILDNALEGVPDLILSALYHLLSLLDVLRGALLNEVVEHERLEQLESHLLRETALIHLQLRTNDDNGTSGVVDALTEQVLTETSLLTL